MRAGNLVFVAGTTAPEAALAGDVGQQFAAAARRIGDALDAVGASLADVVRTVVYVRSIADIDAIAAAHAAVFGAYPPASTIVEVTGLPPAAALVEVEATAVLAA